MASQRESLRVIIAEQFVPAAAVFPLGRSTWRLRWFPRVLLVGLSPYRS